MKRVLYCGDGSIRAEIEVKGAEAVLGVDRVVNMGVYLRSALEREGFEVTHLLPHDTFVSFPRTSEDLARYDLVVLSDIGHDTLALYSGREKFQRQANRLKLVREYVRAGGGLLYCGGYFSFQGRFGHGRWYGTPVAEVLPVEILPIPDDRIETMDGAYVEVIDAAHPVVAGLDWDRCPPFLGYSRTGPPREGAQLLLRIDGDPLLALWTVGDGRCAVFASDPAPHWGVEFVEWPNYQAFWGRVARWCVKEF